MCRTLTELCLALTEEKPITLPEAPPTQDDAEPDSPHSRVLSRLQARRSSLGVLQQSPRRPRMSLQYTKGPTTHQRTPSAQAAPLAPSPTMASPTPTLTPSSLSSLPVRRSYFSGVPRTPMSADSKLAEARQQRLASLGIGARQRAESVATPMNTTRRLRLDTTEPSRGA